MWVLNNCCPTYARNHLILLPSLDWLLEKLREYGFVEVRWYKENGTNSSSCTVEKQTNSFAVAEWRINKVADSNPSMAALLALRRVMGIGEK
jgi:hypothetical protein